MTEDGPELVLADADGKIRTMLAATEEGPALLLSDAAGEIRATLAAMKEGPALLLSDAGGETRAALGQIPLETIRTGATVQTGEGSLVLFDREGKMIFQEP